MEKNEKKNISFNYLICIGLLFVIFCSFAVYIVIDKKNYKMINNNNNVYDKNIHDNNVIENNNGASNDDLNETVNDNCSSIVSDNEQLKNKINELNVQLSDANNKINELNNQINDEKNRLLYYFNSNNFSILSNDYNDILNFSRVFSAINNSGVMYNCMVSNNNLECFKINDHDNEFVHAKEYFGEANCIENNNLFCSVPFGYFSLRPNGNISITDAYYQTTCLVDVYGTVDCKFE